mmetsp:Transcript_61904/g.174494  ORF Transcript_61904/g.174494 Transcript_61904/m.174494 type:complete len:239 (-) Transcript_61904:206-922(-)
MTNQVQDDEMLARQMQAAEMGQLGGQGAAMPRGAAMPQYVVNGVAVGAPVTLGAAGYGGGGLPYNVAVVPDFPREEKVVLTYRSALTCFASIDTVTTLFHALAVVTALFRGKEESDGEEEREGRLGGGALGFAAGYFGLLGLVFIIGPVCGIIGARRLSRNLVSVYFSFCLLKLVFDTAAAFLAPLFFWYLIFVLIQLWITKIVFTFWKALGDIPADRLAQLRDGTRLQNVPTRMVFW